MLLNVELEHSPRLRKLLLVDQPVRQRIEGALAEVVGESAREALLEPLVRRHRGVRAESGQHGSEGVLEHERARGTAMAGDALHFDRWRAAVRNRRQQLAVYPRDHAQHLPSRTL